MRLTQACGVLETKQPNEEKNYRNSGYENKNSKVIDLLHIILLNFFYPIKPAALLISSMRSIGLFAAILSCSSINISGVSYSMHK